MLTRLSVYSHLTRLLVRLYASRRDNKKFQMKPLNAPVYREEWGIIKSEYASMAEFARAGGARLVLISIPNSGKNF